MDNKSFYNLFHKKSHIQNKIITNKNFTYREILRVLERFILRKNRNNKLKVLDYGCGVGVISLYLAKNGHKVIGMDISDKVVKIANNSVLNLNLIKYVNFYNLKKGSEIIKNRKFNLILCIEVIEHVKDDIKLLKFLSSKLKKGGILFLTTPSVNAPLYRLGLSKRFDLNVGHLRRYSVNNISELTTLSGLKVIKVFKTEGIIRNSLFLFPFFGILLKFIKGPLSNIVTIIDNFAVSIFGESDIEIIAIKK